MRRSRLRAALCGALATLCGVPPLAAAVTEPLAAEPRNPWLADSTYPITHVASGQPGSVAVAGPVDRSRTLGDADIAYRFMGPAHLIQVISGPYPDGRRAIWSIGADRVVKQDYASFDIVDTLMLREDSPYSEAWAAERERAIETARGPFAVFQAVREMMLLGESQGLYPLIDRDNEFYVIRNGGIEVYGDVEPGNAGSPIERKRRFEMPAGSGSRLVGLNFTHDGWLVGVSEAGEVVAVTRDFGRHYITRLEGAPAQAADRGGQLSGWIRNSFAIDADGRVYIVSRDFMHCIRWTGRGWSQEAADGAWREPYPHRHGQGLGFHADADGLRRRRPPRRDHRRRRADEPHAVLARRDPVRLEGTAGAVAAHRRSQARDDGRPDAHGGAVGAVGRRARLRCADREQRAGDHPVVPAEELRPGAGRAARDRRGISPARRAEVRVGSGHAHAPAGA